MGRTLDSYQSYRIALSLSRRQGRAVSETIKQSELRNNNAEIMRRVADGESFTRVFGDDVPTDPWVEAGSTPR